MGLVIMFWIIMLALVIIQICAIIYSVKNDKSDAKYGAYSNEVIQKTKAVMKAIQLNIIKKHILTNSAEEYDSRKTLKQYRIFLETDLMKDMMQMHEDPYHG